LKLLQGYFRNQVLPKWRDDPRVIVDVTQYSESPARWAVYVPKKDLFVYMFVPSRMRTSVEPGRVQVVLPPVTGGRPVVVEERLESPAVVVSVDQFCPLASASLDVVVGDHVCSFLRIDVPVLGGPCSVEYVLTLRVGDRMVDEEVLKSFDPVDVEYAVYPDRVVMRIFGIPEGVEDRALVINATFDLRRDRILVERWESADPRLISRLRELKRKWATPPEEGIAEFFGGLLRERSGVKPLLVGFQLPHDDPLVRFVEKVVRMYNQGAGEEELQKAMEEHPNVEFLFPKKGAKEASRFPVWMPPLPLVPQVGRRNSA